MPRSLPVGALIQHTMLKYTTSYCVVLYRVLEFMLLRYFELRVLKFGFSG